MATVILVRHGRTAANAQGVLVGRTPGIALDEVGRAQASRTAERLEVVPLVEVVSSPLDRCLETAAAIVSRREGARPVCVDPALIECDYGLWQGRPLAELAREELWRRVQASPASVVFPEGESMAGMQARAVAAVRAHDAEMTGTYGAKAVWAAVSHGDVIKAILADAFGMHLDLIQRISVGPASVSIVHYGSDGSRVIATNTDAGDLSWLHDGIADADAPVGGGSTP
ncbi:MSMEG_4193 family putative phosphomutase [Planctomonas sp. JC2975]|uniref:MSMEG_4193 family putative phosphomutase n=1 Tax=Planctomonas sp. JC2975 TaxID=2729626 RepID=UPI00147310A0|nr:MSMEG_4193 family putative phosphomutase [Planctomonas sp. JC2975]NNC12145.1 MSMEG_4193 family putative phosphomutase [Planctomonas sp. JC2975]